MTHSYLSLQISHMETRRAGRRRLHPRHARLHARSHHHPEVDATRMSRRPRRNFGHPGRSGTLGHVTAE